MQRGQLEGLAPIPRGGELGDGRGTGLGWEMVGAAVLDGLADRPIFFVVRV